MHGACLPAGVLSGLLASITASGQDAVRPETKSGSEAALKTDETPRNEPDSTRKTDEKAASKTAPEFVNKTDAEWRRILTRTQFAVTRQKATEPAYSGKYATGHFRGTFLCVCCNAELFSAQHKFESGTGWPSFYRPSKDRAIQTAWDYGGPEARVEVMCRRCGAHLGHVFDDGPPPTGLRFCINSVAIKLKPPEGESPERQSASKTSSKSKNARAKVKAKAKSGSKKPVPPTEPQDAPDPADSDRPLRTDQQQGGPRARAPQR